MLGDIRSLRRYHTKVNRPHPDDDARRAEFSFELKAGNGRTVALMYGNFDTAEHVMELANLANDIPALMYTALTRYAKAHPYEFQLPWEE